MDTSLSRLDSEFQLFVLRASDFDLLVERCERRFRFFQRLLIIGRIDFKQQIALLHQLVVLDTKLNDWTADTRNDSDDVSACGRIVGTRVSLQHTPDVERQNNCPEDDQQGDEVANELLASSAILGDRSRSLR